MSSETAEQMLAAGDRQRAVTLLQDEVKNNPEDRVPVDRIRGTFETAEMAAEGGSLVETSRQEALGRMDRDVLLAREGKLREAVEWMRNARDAMPSNLRVLLNLAHVAILCMQESGQDAALADEARASLAAAARRAPGDTRIPQLVEKRAQFSAVP